MAFKVVQLIAFCLAIAVANARAPSKIVNGQTAWQGEFPYQVALTMWGQQFCGGAIIDATHIVTAAHCVVDNSLSVKQPHEIQIVTGTNDINGGTPTNTFDVVRISPHPGYNPQINMHNDIAVITVARPIPFNYYQAPISLPRSNTPAGAVVMASGWGAGEFRGAQSQGVPQLQKLAMQVLSTEDCRYQLGKDIWEHQICVFASSTSGTCVGDSGGPIAYNGELVGVTSFGIPCAKGYPDVFTRVYSYIDWIVGETRY